MLMHIDKLQAICNSAGFEDYGDFETEEREIRNSIMTCIKGEFSGEVIEIYYNYHTGGIVKVMHYCQFPIGHPHYLPVKFSCPVS